MDFTWNNLTVPLVQDDHAVVDRSSVYDFVLMIMVLIFVAVVGLRKVKNLWRNIVVKLSNFEAAVASPQHTAAVNIQAEEIISALTEVVVGNSELQGVQDGSSLRGSD